MNIGTLIVGILIGMGLLIGGSLYLEVQGAPTPESVCNDNLNGTDWSPTNVDIDRPNETVLITCERGNQTKLVTEELNVMDDVSSS